MRICPLLLLFVLLPGCDSKKESGAGAPATSGPVDRVAWGKQLLAEAGFPDGKGFPKLEILYNTDEGHKRIAAFLQQEWRKKLGIEVELRNSEWKVYLDDMSKLRYQLMRRGWIGDYRDPNTFIELFTATTTTPDGRTPITTGSSRKPMRKSIRRNGTPSSPRRRRSCSTRCPESRSTST